MNKKGQIGMVIFLGVVLLLCIIGAITSNNKARLIAEEACEYCGHDNLTDYNNEISKVKVECDGNKYVDVHKKRGGVDKWGDRVELDEPVFWCDWRY